MSVARDRALMGLFAGVACVLALQVMSKEVTGMGPFQISSSAFKQNQMIPSKYTCDGEDVNPPLLIGNAPPEAKSFALIVDDPDAPAGTWVHWVLWNIDPKTTEIREDSVPSGSGQGMSDFKKHDYGGPCPPSGIHRYYFKLYALDTALRLDHDVSKAALERAMQGHVIAQAELIGLYKRK